MGQIIIHHFEKVVNYDPPNCFNSNYADLWSTHAELWCTFHFPTVNCSVDHIIQQKLCKQRGWEVDHSDLPAVFSVLWCWIFSLAVYFLSFLSFVRFVSFFSLFSCVVSSFPSFPFKSLAYLFLFAFFSLSYISFLLHSQIAVVWFLSFRACCSLLCKKQARQNITCFPAEMQCFGGFSLGCSGIEKLKQILRRGGGGVGEGLTQQRREHWEKNMFCQ